MTQEVIEMKTTKVMMTAIPGLKRRNMPQSLLLSHPNWMDVRMQAISRLETASNKSEWSGGKGKWSWWRGRSKMMLKGKNKSEQERMRRQAAGSREYVVVLSRQIGTLFGRVVDTFL